MTDDRKIVPHAPVRVDAATFGPTEQASAAARAEHVRPVVIDANVLVEEVTRRLPHVVDGVDVQPARSSALADALSAGAVRLYGKADVVEEVMRHLSDVTTLKPRGVGAAISLLESEYLSRMRVVDVSTVVIDDPWLRRVAERHEADEPTARLACLLAPAYVLTRDKDLLANHFGEWFEEGSVPSSWPAIAFTINDRAFESKMEAGTRSVVTGASLASIGVAWAWRARPRLASGIIGAGVATLWFTRRSTTWVAIRDGLKLLLEHAAHEASRHLEDAKRAKAQLAEFERLHPGPGTPESIVARHIAIAGTEGLSAAELYDITGHRFAVRPILVGHRAFSEDEHGRWHMGEPARLPAAQ